MKFTDGNWMLQEGVQLHPPMVVHEADVQTSSVTLYAPCKHIHHRGATLDGPLLTFTIFSPLPDVIGVRVEHYSGAQPKGPYFELGQASNSNNVRVTETEDAITLVSGKTSVRIQKSNFKLDYTYAGRPLTASPERGMAYVTTDDGQTYMREQLNLGVGEFVYGLGERFTPFVKNGQSVDIWNRDGGTSSDQAYKNIPFYLTNRGYGVFVNHPENVSFEVATERVSRVQFSVEGENLEYFILGGATPKAVLERYTALTGRPGLPPAWSFGLWLTTSFTTNYDEETVNHFVDGMRDRNVPLHVFHFDCFWMKEFEWCNFEWDERVFPDPEGMLRRLKAKGLHICVWINPYIAQKSPLFREASEQGYLLKRPNGDVWQWDKWQAGMGLVDFTNPDACAWFASKLERLLDMGVDCFKTDFGERIPTDVAYFDGSNPEKMHNFYAYLYNQCVYDLLQKKRGQREAVLFARSAWAGGQKFPVHWGGDCSASYESMAESLRGGLSLTLSGFGFWSHDIGGFESTSSADLYKRWIAFGLLSSHSRLHGNSSYRVPWLYDDEAVDVLRHFTQLKSSLMPYLYTAACEATEQGTPVMRAMFLEFPGDLAVEQLDRQYMLGPSLLVAPVFREDGVGTYYLPRVSASGSTVAFGAGAAAVAAVAGGAADGAASSAEGVWTHLLTGQRVIGGTWGEEKYGYTSLPLFVRPNSVVAVGANIERPDYDYVDAITFHAFELADGVPTQTPVYGTDAQLALMLRTARAGSSVVFTLEPGAGSSSGSSGSRSGSATAGAGRWRVLLRNVEAVSNVVGGRVLDASAADGWVATVPGVLVEADAGTSELRIELA